ncbi:hypothetical protein ACFVXA_17800 [Streptomyces sp. NPDC058246]|uniref:hypothetical protein n=1 Tax=Streptomyces sp. NPDC058246 TaxID=3346400 RepID=UPI0036E9031E
MAHTYALIAEVTLPTPRQEQSPTEPLVEEQYLVPSVPEPGDEVTPQSEDGTASGAEAEPNPNNAVPPLLVRAHQAVVRAGGTMYTSDLADALGMRTQQLGTELVKILRAAGVSRPKSGSVSPSRGMPFRTGFTAETLATGIAMYGVRAELAVV